MHRVEDMYSVIMRKLPTESEVTMKQYIDSHGGKETLRADSRLLRDGWDIAQKIETAESRSTNMLEELVGAREGQQVQKDNESRLFEETKHDLDLEVDIIIKDNLQVFHGKMMIEMDRLGKAIHGAADEVVKKLSDGAWSGIHDRVSRS